MPPSPAAPPSTRGVAETPAAVSTGVAAASAASSVTSGRSDAVPGASATAQPTPELPSAVSTSTTYDGQSEDRANDHWPAASLRTRSSPTGPSTIQPCACLSGAAERPSAVARARTSSSPGAPRKRRTGPAPGPAGSEPWRVHPEASVPPDESAPAAGAALPVGEPMRNGARPAPDPPATSVPQAARARAARRPPTARVEPVRTVPRVVVRSPVLVVVIAVPPCRGTAIVPRVPPGVRRSCDAGHRIVVPRAG